MGKILGGLLGVKKPPTVSQAPIVEVKEDEKKTKKRTSALYATEGGSGGEELQSVQSSRGNIFGN